MKKILLFVIFLFVSLSGCKKDSMIEPIKDTEKPTVSVLFPASGSDVKADTVYVVIADANDNTKVTKVDFYINGQNSGADSLVPFEYRWSTQGLTTTQTIMAKAFDEAGNVGTSAVISVSIKGAANHAPVVPSNSIPTDAATGVSKEPTLSWSCSDPDGNALTYDVYFGTSSNPATTIATNQPTPSISWGGLADSTTYFWRIVAKDSKGATTSGPVWSFTTARATSLRMYVLNSLGASISVIDLTKDTVYNNVATVGMWPNQILYSNAKLYVVNSGSNNVQVFDASTYVLKGTISLGANNNPMLIAILSSEKAYVTCSQSNCVKVVNPTTFAVLKTIPMGVGATGIAITNGKVYVANTAFDGATYAYGQGTVSVVSTTADTVIKTINVSTNPQGCAVAPNGKLHVLCTGDYAAEVGKLAIIDPSVDALVQTVTVGGNPSTIAVASSGTGYLGTFGQGIIRYNATTYAVQDFALSGKDGSGVAFDLLGNVYVAAFGVDKVFKLDVNNIVKREYSVGDGPLSLSPK
jgi:YVTN family beta-propeller protein